MRAKREREWQGSRLWPQPALSPRAFVFISSASRIIDERVFTHYTRWPRNIRWRPTSLVHPYRPNLRISGNSSLSDRAPSIPTVRIDIVSSRSAILIIATFSSWAPIAPARLLFYFDESFGRLYLSASSARWIRERATRRRRRSRRRDYRSISLREQRGRSEMPRIA